MWLSPARIYSLYYFSLFAFVAYTLTTYPLFLEYILFTPSELALYGILSTLSVVVATPLLMNLAHHTYSPQLLARACAVTLLLIYPFTLFLSSPSALSAVWMLIFAAIRTSTIIEAHAVRSGRQGNFRFERVRSWGSIGFIAASAISGVLADVSGTANIPWAGAVILIFHVVLTWQVAHHLPATCGRGRVETDTAEIKKNPFLKPQYLALLASNVCIWASHACLYVYLSVYLRELGWNGTWITSAWNLGVLAEILFFLWFPKQLSALAVHAIFSVCIGATALRWFILAWTENAYLILASQLLHELSLGGCYLCSLRIVYEVLPESHRDRGQGHLQSTGFGLGSLIGRFGILALAPTLSTYRDLDSLFSLSAWVAIIGLVTWIVFGHHRTQAQKAALETPQLPT